MTPVSDYKFRAPLLAACSAALRVAHQCCRRKKSRGIRGILAGNGNDSA
jgi:hypothetical protein